MARERKIVGLWPASQPQVEQTAVGMAVSVDHHRHDEARDDAVTDQSGIEGPDAYWDGNELATGATPSRVPWIAIFLTVVGLMWIAGYAWMESNGFTRLLPPEALPASIAIVATPLILLVVLWMAWERGSERSMQRHLRTLAAVRAEQHGLADRLATIDRHWIGAQQTLETRSRDVTGHLLETSRRMDEAGCALEQRMREIAGSAALVTEQGEAALRHMDGLAIALPKVDEVARKAAETFRTAGQTAYQLGGQLEERVAALNAEAGDAEARLTSAEGVLTRRAGELSAAVTAADTAASGISERFARALSEQRDAALAMLADLTAELDNGAGTIESRIEATRQRLQADAQKHLTAINDSIGSAERNAVRMADVARVASDRSAKNVGAITVTVDAMTGQLATFEADSAQRIEALLARYEVLGQTFVALGSATAASDADALQLIERVNGYAAALAEARREVDEALPSALGTLQRHVAETRVALAALPDLVAANADGAAATLARLQEAELLIARQAETLAALSDGATKTLSGQRESLAGLQASVSALATAMAAIRDEAAPALTDSVRAAEEIAEQSADRARAAIAAVASDSASNVEQAISAAIDSATGDVVAQRIASIAASAEQAVAAANAASERLMRQLITIADSSAAIEARVAENSAQVEGQSRDSLARQFALASESLQSAAVDLTRILSTEVSDQAWEGYLRGDRGIFARRAVRLLTSGEAKDVLARYQSEDEFRALVNRYIHDFEAMLRNVMDTRDGPALSVTLLSSDIGKVYVALAQAIERLRG